VEIKRHQVEVRKRTLRNRKRLQKRYGGWWWLRSPNYNNSNNARDINNDGNANNNNNVNNKNGGVVPDLPLI
jgi:hypothetical protein